jgi:hypothetical protein
MPFDTAAECRKIKAFARTETVRFFGRQKINLAKRVYNTTIRTI